MKKEKKQEVKEPVFYHLVLNRGSVNHDVVYKIEDKVAYLWAADKWSVSGIPPAQIIDGATYISAIDPSI